MGTGKKFIILATTFLCFTVGLFYLFNALHDLHSIETMKITWIMEESSQMNIETVEEGVVSGSRIVALLLVPFDCEVKVNGNKVMTGNENITNIVDLQKKYWLKREYRESLSKPVLIITEYESDI